MAASAPAPRAWLFGPIPDLLLGCGALYLFVTLAYVFSDVPLPGNQTRALLVLALSTPHYGATILRVYEQRQERRAYALFAVWATLLVAGAFVAGLMMETIGAWLVTMRLAMIGPVWPILTLPLVPVLILAVLPCLTTSWLTA